MYTDPCEMDMSMLNAQKVGRADAFSKISVIELVEHSR